MDKSSYADDNAHDTPTDDRIHREIRNALDSNLDLDATGIQIQVRNGVVRFTGWVDSEQMRELAEGCLNRLPGVKKMVNDLQIQRTM